MREIHEWSKVCAFPDLYKDSWTDSQGTFGARKGNYRWIRVTADGFACHLWDQWICMSVLQSYSAVQSSELGLGTHSLLELSWTILPSFCPSVLRFWPGQIHLVTDCENSSTVVRPYCFVASFPWKDVSLLFHSHAVNLFRRLICLKLIHFFFLWYWLFSAVLTP